MKKNTSMILSAVLGLSLMGCSSSANSTNPDSKTLKVAIVKQLDHASLDEIADAIASELDAISEKEGITIEYGDIYSGQNDQSTLKQIGDTVMNDGVDCIIPIATLAAQTMVVSRGDNTTPIVFAAISDPETADLTGLENVTGTSDALNTKQILDMMKAQKPDIKKVGLLYSKSEANSEKPIADAKEYLDSLGISYVEATANTNDEVIAAANTLMSDKVDAVFTPTDNVIMAAEISVAEIFADAKIPHYTGADSFVRNGAFVTCGVNYTELGKQTADIAYEAMSKGMSGMDDYTVVDGGIITVNTETAEKLGISTDVFKDFGQIVEVTTTEE